MTDAKAKEDDHPLSQKVESPTLNTAEGQQARNASSEHLESIKATNANASDGSVGNWAKMTQADKYAYAEQTGQVDSFAVIEEKPSGDEVVAARQYAPGTVLRSQVPVMDLSEVDSRPIRDYGWDETHHGKTKRIETGIAYEVGKPQQLTEQGLFEKIAALPLDQQAQVLGAGIKAYCGEMSHQQFRIGVGAISGLGDSVVGMAQGAETLGKAILGVAQFSRDVMANDPASIDTAAKVGESVGKLLVGGIRIYSAAETYLESVGAATNVGDYEKPLRDIAWLGRQMNDRWEAMSPEEKTRIVTRLSVDALGSVASGMVINRVAKSIDITGALEELGQTATTFGSGQRQKYHKLIAGLADAVMPEKGLTANGMTMPYPSDKNDFVAKMIGRSGNYSPERKPMFWTPGSNKLLKEGDIESFGGLTKLESMTDGELAAVGIRRFEMPKLRLDATEYSGKATIPGDKQAWAQISIPKPGTVVVDHLDKGAMPDGTGGHFFAEMLKGHGIIPTDRIVLKNVVNPESLEAFKAGRLPQDTKIAKTIANALKELRIVPAGYRYEQIGDKLNIVIDIR